MLKFLEKEIGNYNVNIKSKKKEDNTDIIKRLEQRLERIGLRFELGDITADEYKNKREEIKKRVRNKESITNNCPKNDYNI